METFTDIPGGNGGNLIFIYIPQARMIMDMEMNHKPIFLQKNFLFVVWKKNLIVL